jgi:hypothetical protein
VIAYADDLMILVKGTTQVEVEDYANIEKKGRKMGQKNQNKL